MKKGAGKRKGSQFERDVARMFDTWWGVSNGTFWRSVNSGGWKEPGDIVSRDKSMWFPFVVECKSYKSVNLLDIFKADSKDHPLRRWFQQLRHDTDRYRVMVSRGGTGIIAVTGLLVFKYNRGPIFIAFESGNSGMPSLGRSLPDMDYVSMSLKLLPADKDKTTVTIMPIEQFFESYTRSVILQIFQAYGVPPNENKGQ